MLGLAILPCSDAFYECMSNSNRIKQTTQTAEHNHKKEHKDFCSPFCLCQCCGTIAGATLNFKTPEIQMVKFHLDDKRKVSPHYRCKSLFPYYGNIWQPPKINI